MTPSAKARALTVARIKATEKAKPHLWDSRKAGPWDRRQHKADGGGVFSDEEMGLGATAAPSLLSDADMGIPPPSSSLRSVALQVPTGFNETLANGVGAPVDAMTWALNHIPGVKIKDPVMGSDFIKRGMGLIGANPDNAPDNTPAERIARGTGSGVAAMVAPEAAVGAAGELGALAPSAVKSLKGIFGSSETLPAALGNAGVGAVSGAGGSTASELAPEPYKPLAEMGGNLVGGTLGVAGVQAARGARWLGNAAKDYFAPLTEAGQEQSAGKKLADRSTSPAALRDALDNPPPEMVPGSKPTTFQQTGDMGLGSLERETATQSPAEFMQRRAEQNSARVSNLESLATGSPADVSNTLRAHLRDLDEATRQSVERVQADAQRQIDGVGGQRPPEEYGASMRAALASARQEAKTQERALWKAVDPDNTLALPASSLKDAASGLENVVTGSAKPIDGEERAILDTIGQYRSVMPFNEITDLRSRVSTALREELRSVGETPVYGRLSRLRGAIENTIANAVEYRAAQDAQAVARGELKPEDAIAARVQGWQDVWYARQAEAGALNSASIGSNAGARSAAVSGPRRTAGQAGERFGSSPGDQRLPRDVPLAPNFDKAARDRLNAATAATRDRKQTYDAGPVGTALKSAGMQGQYRSMDSAVPAQIFKRGPSGFQPVEAFRKAAGDPKAMGVLGDYAAASLRQAALRPDGTLDPVRFTAWRKAHADALRAIPELAGRFEDAATASRAVEDVAAIRRDAKEHYQRGVFGQLIDAHGPEDVTRVIGGLFGQKDSTKAAIALPPVVGSKIFNDEYAECLELHGPAAKPGDRSSRSEGTLGWVIAQYRSPKNALWTVLSDGTKDVYNRTFDWLDENWGRVLFSTLAERHVRKIRDELKDRPTVADRAVDKVGMLWGFAKEFIPGMDRIGPNPAKEVKSIHTGHKSHPAWPPELMAAIEVHPNPRIVRAYFLLRYTGQRRSDVVTMDKARFDGTAIQVIQEKTGTPVWIPAHKRLRDHLTATGIPGEYLLESGWGLPYRATSLTNMIIIACKDAGFPGYSPHGLRHSAGSALAEAGCSVHEIMSILGHTTEKEAYEYVRQANRKVMAKSGVDKWEAKSDDGGL